MEDSEMKIIFFGTPHMGAIVLEKLMEADMKPVLSVTMQDKPANRGQKLTPSPVKLISESHGIPVIQPEDFSSIPPEITAAQADIFVVAAYGVILPKQILEIPPKGVLNVHPSLLPKYRGPSPVQAAILDGETETGVTIICLDEEMDHGPIVAKEKYEGNLSKITALELKHELGVLAGELLSKTMPLWMEGKITPQPQDHSKATFTEIIKKEDGHIDWNNAAEHIERQIRAYEEWPGAYTFVDNPKGTTLRLKLLSAEVQQGATKTQGLVSSDFEVETGSGILAVTKLQMEGKDEMTAADFIRGYPWIISSVLK